MARKKLEIDIENDCIDAANELDIPSVKLEKVARSWPDRCFFLPGGRPLIVEFKRPGVKVRNQQGARLKKLRKLGYRVYVVDNVNFFLALII